MKTIFKTPVVVFLLVFAKEGQSQTNDSRKLPYMDAFLTSPRSSVADNKVGIGFNFFSQALNQQNQKQVSLFELRLGGGFYYSPLMATRLGNVPLAAPQTGLASVTIGNSIAGFNAIARLSGPSSKRVVPYADLFAGFMDISCGMNVNPVDKQYSSTSQNLNNYANYNYGFSAGILISASRSVKMTLSLSSIYTPVGGRMVDIHSAHLESNTVVMDRMDAPAHLFMVNTGIVLFMGNSYGHGHSGCRSSYYHSGYHSYSHCGGGHSGGHVNVHIR